MSGFADTDPELKPNLWVDWNHDGAESLVLAEDWKHQTTDENGILTFYVEHTYQDDKNTEDENFNPIFRVDDLTGRSNDSEVPLSIANVAPVATLGIPKLDGSLGGSEIFAPNEAVRVAFAGVQDVSKADLDAGMTYYFQIDGKLADASKVPTYAFHGLAKGHTYTVSAYVEDKDGGRSPTYTYEVKVHSGIVVELQTPNGNNSVDVYWYTEDGTPTFDGYHHHDTLEAGERLTFLDATVHGISVHIYESGTYDLTTNAAFNDIKWFNVGGVTVNIDTTKLLDQAEYAGDGSIDYVGGTTLSNHININARGDLREIYAPDSHLDDVRFDNSTGKITALYAESIHAVGYVNDIDISHATSELTAYELKGTFKTAYGPNSIAGRLVTTLGPGWMADGSGFDVGKQTPKWTAYRLDEAGQVIWAFLEGDFKNRKIEYTYASNGAIETVRDIHGIISYKASTDGSWIVDLDHTDRPLGDNIPLGSAPQPKALPAPGWIETVIQSGIELATDAYAEASQFVTTAIAAGEAVVSYAWEQGTDIVRHTVDTLGKATLEIGNSVLELSREIGKGLMDSLSAIGIPVGQFITTLETFVGVTQLTFEILLRVERSYSI